MQKIYYIVFFLLVRSKLLLNTIAYPTSQESSEGTVEKKSSVLNLVDLAGSERQKETQTEGDVLKVT